MEDGGLGTLRAVLAILQWWGFNVTVIIMNKWIFQVLLLLIHSVPASFSHLCLGSDLGVRMLKVPPFPSDSERLGT
jgi:solute carrier family 35, member E3